MVLSSLISTRSHRKFPFTLAEVARGSLLALAAAYMVGRAVRSDLPWPWWRVAAVTAFRLAILAALAAWMLDRPLHVRRASRAAQVVAVVDQSPSISPEGRGRADAMVAEGLLTKFQAGHLKVGKWQGFFLGRPHAHRPRQR